MRRNARLTRFHDLRPLSELSRRVNIASETCAFDPSRPSLVLPNLDGLSLLPVEADEEKEERLGHF